MDKKEKINKSVKNTQEDKGAPMPFHDNFKKNIVWYIFSMVIVLAVLLVNFTEINKFIFLPKSITNSPIKKQEVNSNKDIKSIKNSLNDISEKYELLLNKLNDKSKLNYSLNESLTKIHNEIKELKQNKAKQNVIKPYNNLVLGLMMLSFVNNFNHGNIDYKELNKLKDFIKNVIQNENILKSINNLTDTIETKKTVTLIDILVSFNKLTSKDKNILKIKGKVNEKDYAYKIKNYISNFVEVKKIDPNHKELLNVFKDIKPLIIKGNINKVKILLDNNKALFNGKDIENLRSTVNNYLKQQQALKDLFKAYNNINKVKKS